MQAHNERTETVKERETDRQTDKERETDRPTERLPKNRKRDRQIDRELEKFHFSTLTFGFTLLRFGSCFDVLACALMFWLAL